MICEAALNCQNHVVLSHEYNIVQYNAPAPMGPSFFFFGAPRVAVSWLPLLCGLTMRLLVPDFFWQVVSWFEMAGQLDALWTGCSKDLCIESLKTIETLPNILNPICFYQLGVWWQHVALVILPRSTKCWWSRGEHENRGHGLRPKIAHLQTETWVTQEEPKIIQRNSNTFVMPIAQQSRHQHQRKPGYPSLTGWAHPGWHPVWCLMFVWPWYCQPWSIILWNIIEPKAGVHACPSMS